MFELSFLPHGDAKRSLGKPANKRWIVTDSATGTHLWPCLAVGGGFVFLQKGAQGSIQVWAG